MNVLYHGVLYDWDTFIGMVEMEMRYKQLNNLVGAV